MAKLPVVVMNASNHHDKTFPPDSGCAYSRHEEMSKFVADLKKVAAAIRQHFDNIKLRELIAG